MEAGAGLGPFTLLAPLGEGGMGVVWSARFGEREVALKWIRDDLDDTGLLDEAAVVARLQHPHIVEVLDFGVSTDADPAVQQGILPSGRSWVAMELVPDGSLAEAAPTMGWEDVRLALLQLLDALAHSHAHGVLHRDVKPANVLRDGPIWRLADFGIAQVVGEDEQIRAGTMHTMPPEQLQGFWRDYGPPTDLYAVGATAWALVTGRWLQGSVGDVLGRKKLPELQPRIPVPDGLHRWLQGMLAPDPLDRFAKASDAAFALAALGSADSGTGGAPLPQSGATFSLQALTRTMPVTPMWADLHVRPNRVRPQAAPPPLDWRTPPRAFPRTDALGLGLVGLRPIPFVGREAELDALWAALLEVHRSVSAQAVVVAGPARSGRSRLIEAFAQRASELGAAEVLHLAAGAPDPVRVLLEQTLRLTDLSQEERSARIDREAGRLGADAPEVGILQRALNGRVDRWSVLTTLVAIASQDRPVILVIDDADQNPASLAIVRRWLGLRDVASQAVLVVLASTAAGAEPLVAVGATPLAIGPIPPSRWDALVHGALGLERSLARRLSVRVAGDPDVLRQTLAEWHRRGWLVPDAAGFVLAEPGAIDALPVGGERWQGEWREVSARLDAPARTAMELLAVLGAAADDARWEAACAAAGLPSPSRLDLSPAFRAGLLGRNGSGVVLAGGGLGLVIRAAARAAGRLEALHGWCADGLAEVGPTWAHTEHLFGAGRTEEAVRAAIRGGWDLLPISRELATRLLERALAAAATLPEDPERDALLLEKLGWIRYSGGDRPEAERYASQALVLADQLDSMELRAAALHTLGRVARDAGRAEEGEQMLREAADGFETTRPDSAGYVRCTLLEIQSDRDPDGAMREAERLTKHPHPMVRAMALQSLARFELRWGRIGAAELRAREAVAVAEADGRLDQASGSLLTLCTILRRLGRDDEAAGAVRRALSLTDPASRAAVMARANLGMLAASAGDWAESRRCWTACQEWAERTGERLLLGPFLLSRLPDLAAARDWEALDATLERGARLSAEAGMWHPDALILVERAAGLCRDAGETARADALMAVVDGARAANRGGGS